MADMIRQGKLIDTSKQCNQIWSQMQSHARKQTVLAVAEQALDMYVPEGHAAHVQQLVAPVTLEYVLETHAAPMVSERRKR